MPLININYKHSYRSPRDNIVEDFLIPSLKEAVKYDRAVGFFSSSALLDLTVGIKKLVENSGKIRVICSPRLSEEDVQAIKMGYKTRKEILENEVDVIDKEFRKIEDYFEQERLNILAHLIALNILDIKIAVPNSSSMGIYHEKLGIMKDSHDNFVVFSGSMNDSNNAYYQNYETIDVFTSFSSDYERALEKKISFDSLWNNNDNEVDVLEFTESLAPVLKKYKKVSVNFNIDNEQFRNTKEVLFPIIPNWLKIRDYQEEAYTNWKNNNYIGIYDMATGTGKTITALASVTRLLNDKKKLGIIICCPYQHLVDQWCEDLDGFNYKYIIGHSQSKDKNWKKKLKRSVTSYSYGIINYFCLIITNDSFKSAKVQDILKDIKGDVCLVIDEAHNFGTKKLLSLLDDKYKYRLALSATIERHNDSFGTQKLYDYFNGKCFIYSLEKAISEGKLTNYEYYPIVIYLSEDELEKYNELSEKLSKYIIKKPDGSIDWKNGAEMIMIQRARIVAGAKMKLEKLKEVMTPYKNDNHILVYCGAATVFDSLYKEGLPDKEELKQIEAVQFILSNELNIRVAKFTSSETAEQRNILKKEFDLGKDIQVLAAIRCLDEGVNIPSIDKAFILASSTNPKEYIQRRGRVLRTYPGKTHATIYDFVTLPRDLDSISRTDDLSYDMSLIRREIIRVKDFAKLSLNIRDSDMLIEEIEKVYGHIKEEGMNYDN